MTPTGNDLLRVAIYAQDQLAASLELLGPRLALALAAENFADTRYATSGAGRAFFAGPPRRLAAALSTSF